MGDVMGWWSMGGKNVIGLVTVGEEDNEETM